MGDLMPSREPEGSLLHAYMRGPSVDDAIVKSLVLRGLCLAVLGALTVGLGATFGLDLDQVALLGVALGGVVGLVPDRASGLANRRLRRPASPWPGRRTPRVRGFLPDTSSGRAVATFGVLMVLVALALATRANLPLWSMLVGSAAMAGAYEETYTAFPSPMFMTDSPVAATSGVARRRNRRHRYGRRVR